MSIRTNLEPRIAEQISAVREFNRFYTARFGLLRRRHLDGEFSLTEARILYEIGANPLTKASALRAILELDPGYISRLLASLTRRRFVRQATSKNRRPRETTQRSPHWEKVAARLNEQSTANYKRCLQL